MRLSDFNALSFDCYGTLIDWETGIAEALRPLSERSGVSADRLLEAYGPVEHAIEIEQPGLLYSRLLERVHERLSAQFGVDPDDLAAAKFGASVGDWPAFPDSAEALGYLKQHFKLIILSNVDRQSFAASNRRLGVEFDHIFTAQDIGSYKPDLRNFEYLVAGAGRRRDSQGPAPPRRAEPVSRPRPGEPDRSCVGVDRPPRGQGRVGSNGRADPMPHYDFRFTSLAELAAAHRAELRKSRIARELAGLSGHLSGAHGRPMHHPLRLTVEKAAIQSNWRWLAERSGVAAGAAVKADGMDSARARQSRR